MERQVKTAIQTIQSYDSGRGKRIRHGASYPLLMERDIVVLWGMYRGWSSPAIAETAKASVSTVKRQKLMLAGEPWPIFRCLALHQGLRGRKPVYRGEFCGAMMLVSEKKAREHVALRLSPDDMIRLHGMMRERNW